MKKIVFFFVMMVLVVAMGATCYSAVSLDILNPVVFSRSKGEPVTEVYTFSSTFGGPATLKIINGDLNDPSVRRVTNATVMLNGKIIFGPLKLNLFTKQLEATVPLVKGNNTLRVISISLPGGRMTIEIDQTVTNVTVAPTTVRLTSPGSTSQLKVMGKLSDGTAVDISGPSFGTSYSSADISIATALSDGLLTANALGQTTVTVSNDDFSVSVPVTVAGDPPTVSNLKLSYIKLPVFQGKEGFTQSLMYEFGDPDMNIKTVNFTITPPSGPIQSSSDPFSPDQPTGVGTKKFIIDSSYSEGQYHVGVELVDAFGNSSGIQTKSFSIDPSIPKSLEITGIDPTSGKSGDRLIITGRGFETDPLANKVAFVSAFQKAEVLSATTTQLEIVVPVGAKTGTIRLMTALGRADSLTPFTVIPSISLSPTSTQLLTESTADFSCVPSGTETFTVNWSINGQSSPDPSFGVIDNSGHFIAPPGIPPVNPLILRCTSVDDQTLYAEAKIEVVAPALLTGQDLVQRAMGGQMTSTWGEVTIDIPPLSLSADTIISIQALDPTTITAPAEDLYIVAAAQFEPSGLQLSQPANLTFSLRSWHEQGTTLTVYLADGPTGAINTGKTAIVDETGLKATTTIDHFSTYYLTAPIKLNDILVEDYYRRKASSITPYFEDFIILTSNERPFLEGLSVPVVVKLGTGAKVGIGPFLVKGLSVKTSKGSTIGSIVQPSPDGWELVTVIRFPIANGCHEGDEYNENLIIDFQNTKVASFFPVISIPFTVKCLNDLSFSRWSRPNHLPGGAWVEEYEDGTVTVHLYTENTYRLSRLYVGEGGILKINYAETPGGSAPAVIEVTGGVVVRGIIQSTGDDGWPGTDGDDSHYICWKWAPIPGPNLCHSVRGGSGGEGGFPLGGKGGQGGPYTELKCSEVQPVCSDGYVCPDGLSCSETDCYNYVISGGIGTYCTDHICDNPCRWVSSNDGEKGDKSPTGGKGGQGGLLWDAGSWLSFLHDGYSFVKDVVAIVGSVGTDAYAWAAAIQDGYGLIKDGMKIWDNDVNEMRSTGEGGFSCAHRRDHSNFFPPIGGGGGGGAGKKEIDVDFDSGGGGGGGGGGGAPSLKLVTTRGILILNGGMIRGTGGNGGHGGHGDSGLQGPAAPGGGGGGGAGAQISIIANEIEQYGKIDLKGGLGGASGFMTDDEDRRLILLEESFGQSGGYGYLRLDGKLKGNRPNGIFYQGLALDYTGNYPEVTSTSPFCRWIDNYTKSCINPVQGLNTYPVNMPTLHPWQKQFVFYYPGWQDSDGDGLNDAIETTIGTNPNNTDSDGDGVPDGEEVLVELTDPLKSDTDSDGYSDWCEIMHYTQPRNPSSHPYSFTITRTGAGTGTVTATPAWLDCGSKATYSPGTPITLKANPAEGSSFAGWSGGGCSGTNLSCNIVVTADTAIVANFQIQVPVKLTVTKSGSGSGTVTSTPAGIDCGSVCEETFVPGTFVTLNAVSSTGSYFAGWSGGGCSGSAHLCGTTISIDTTIFATFEMQEPKASMQDARYDHTATLLSDGKVLLAGGEGSEGYLSSTEIFDPVSGTFVTTGSMGAPRVYHTANLLPDGKVLVAGGWNSEPNSYADCTAEIYDPATGTFGPFIDMTHCPHSHHTATLLPPPSDIVLIMGWAIYPETGGGSLEAYYNELGAFSFYGEDYIMETERWGHTATLLPDGRVLIAGGNGASDSVYYYEPLASAELWRSNEVHAFSTTGSMSIDRIGHTATLLPDGKVLVVGGGSPYYSAELYDPSMGAFSLTGSLFDGRMGYHTATLLPNGKVLIAGGFISEVPGNSAELYDPTTGTFSATGSMNMARAQHTATLLPDGRVFIVGGDSYQGILDSYEIYNPATGQFE